MTAKPRVPKTIHDFTQILFDTEEQTGCRNVLAEDFKPQPPVTICRLVEDDLLRERFAFAGHKVVPADAVVLTREEACRLLKAMKLAFDCVDERKAPQWFLDARHALQSKLKAQEDGK